MVHWVLEHNGKRQNITTLDSEGHTAHKAWQKGQRLFAGCPSFPQVAVFRLPRVETTASDLTAEKLKIEQAWEKLRGNRRTRTV